MGKRFALGLVAALAIGSLSAAAAPVAVGAVPAEIAVEQPAWAPSFSLNPDLADKAVASTPKAAPDVLDYRWESCELPITIDYTAGPGVDADMLAKQLAYPVRYFQALGYYVAIGNEVSYKTVMDTPTTPGAVLVVAENDSPRLKVNAWRAVSDRLTTGSAFTSAKITVDPAGGMASDVLLHELGHVVGLEHKHGSVMDIPTPGSPVWFDAAETAAIDCR